MNTRLRFTLIVLLSTLPAGCQLVLPTPTPLPGWRSPVSELMVDDSAFPQDWRVLFPADTQTDPTVNHVGRRWGHASGADAEQNIWRAYTISDAEKKYAELIGAGVYKPRLTDYPGFFVQFKPPAEISYQSQIADEFNLACGWDDVAQCIVLARYRNYVVQIRVDHEAAIDGRQSDGLTDAEIEAVIEAMDAKFAAKLDVLPTPSDGDQN